MKAAQPASIQPEWSLSACYTKIVYNIYRKKSNRRVSAISVDTDQTPWKGIWSGSILFATHPGVLDISDGIKMDMFKF